ncbi:hypothetical protein M426DRAFT_66038 [Hypoxylon sp. CI-4A]|nr:hypothetical protein M426DRAFT_66038 [Hypoxylon sp. CI-4A]
MNSSLANHSCVPSTFSTPTLLGGQILGIEAAIVSNYSYDIPTGWRYSQPAVDVENAEFCNVTITYTHTGQNDSVVVETWLPIDSWNERLQSVGGGGFQAGRFALGYAAMAGAIYDGYATTTTDGGLGTASYPSWALVSPGNFNLVALDDLGHTTLNDMAIIAKDVIQSYYGKGPSYSYFNACSQGGRQASILAQQYPTAYDGIIAAAPGMWWAELMLTAVWPTFYMDLTEQYPDACELTQLTSLAKALCDKLDGIEDGLIAEPEECRQIFSASEYVGTTFNCSTTGESMNISEAAVAVANAVWDGPRYSNGDFLWYGFEIGSDLATLAATTCGEDGQCTAASSATYLWYYQTFVLKDPTADVTNLTHAQFDTMYRSFKRTFASSLEATETDIVDFRDAGGKMITYHGLADAAISPGGTLHYYNQVMNKINNTSDFYRYFRVPGLEHCYGGDGGQPVALFDQLRSWVENGTAPDSTPVTIQQSGNATRPEILCPYPKKATFRQSCINSTSASATECWSCD